MQSPDQDTVGPGDIRRHPHLQQLIVCCFVRGILCHGQRGWKRLRGYAVLEISRPLAASRNQPRAAHATDCGVRPAEQLETPHSLTLEFANSRWSIAWAASSRKEAKRNDRRGYGIQENPLSLQACLPMAQDHGIVHIDCYSD